MYFNGKYHICFTRLRYRGYSSVGRYGIILSQMDYIFIARIVILILGYAMTLCYLEEKLGKV
jgi:hypothetical protein